MASWRRCDSALFLTHSLPDSPGLGLGSSFGVLLDPLTTNISRKTARVPENDALTKGPCFDGP